MTIEPEARLGFWAVAMLLRLHQSPDVRAAVDIADDALREFDAMARDMPNTNKDQPS